MTDKEQEVQEATRHELAELFEPAVVRRSSDYVRKLIVAWPYVYAALYNQGGSIILQGHAADTESTETYSSVIGSSIHNDLIELIQAMESLSKSEQTALFAWGQDLKPTDAANLLKTKGGKIKLVSQEAYRQRRSRAIKKVTEVLDGESGTRGNGGHASGSRRETSED